MTEEQKIIYRQNKEQFIKKYKEKLTKELPILQIEEDKDKKDVLECKKQNKSERIEWIKNNMFETKPSRSKAQFTEEIFPSGNEQTDRKRVRNFILNLQKEEQDYIANEIIGPIEMKEAKEHQKLGKLVDDNNNIAESEIYEKNRKEDKYNVKIDKKLEIRKLGVIENNIEMQERGTDSKIPLGSQKDPSNEIKMPARYKTEISENLPFRYEETTDQAGIDNRWLALETRRKRTKEIRKQFFEEAPQTTRSYSDLFRSFSHSIDHMDHPYVRERYRNRTKSSLLEARSRSETREGEASSSQSPNKFRLTSRTFSEEVLPSKANFQHDYVQQTPKKYQTGCYIEPKTVPVQYSSTIYLKIGTNWKKFLEEIQFKNRLVASRYTESIETPPQQPIKRFTSSVEIECQPAKKYGTKVSVTDKRRPVYI